MKRSTASESERLQLPLERIRPPVVVVLGSPKTAAAIVKELAGPVTCFQLDLYQASRLREEIGNGRSEVVTAPDLWDLGQRFQTAILPATAGGERHLQLDMLDQALHVLQPRGNFVALSPHSADEFFPKAIKKTYGRMHVQDMAGGQTFWARREDDQPRRRHEVTFQVRGPGNEALRFVSRPGVFAWGRFDDGGRALVETAAFKAGDRVLDLGCGAGTNGVWAGKIVGESGHVCFMDSNVRAVQLSALNARTNGLRSFTWIASCTLDQPSGVEFDTVLANPPYYAEGSIARLFIERGQKMLAPGGAFYLVTKQPGTVTPMMIEVFPDLEAAVCRGYTVLVGKRAESEGVRGEE